MATIVFDNAEGAGNGLWSTNTNWVGDALPATGDTAQISADCTMDTSDIIAAFIVNAGKTLTIADGVSLTGLASNCTLNGALVAGAGCTISANANATIVITCGSASIFTINGTSGAGITTITNVNAGGSAKVQITSPYQLAWSFVDMLKCARALSCSVASKYIILRDCNFEGTDSDYGISFSAVCDFVSINDSFISKFNSAGNPGALRLSNAPMPTDVRLNNVVFGKDRDGNAQANAIDIYFGQKAGPIYGRNLLCNSTTQIDAGAGARGRIVVDNWGCAGGSGTPGIGYERELQIGSSVRSTLAKKTGDYGTRCTPESLCSGNQPLEVSLYVPIASGQSIAVSVWGLRHGITDGGTENAIAEVEIDPEGAWFTPTTSTAVTMTNADAWYEFTATASTAGGTGAKGMVRVVLRLKQYTASGYFDWADFVATVT